MIIELVKTIRKNFSFFISSFSAQKGFTLIELIFVFSMIAILTVSSIAAFSAFNKTQVFQTTANEYVSLLQVAKSRSLSQVKPTQCTNRTLQGYQVVNSILASTYQLDVVCGNNTYMIERKTLPAGVTFASGSPLQVRFAVSTGTVSTPATITLTGENTNKIVTVDATGNISVR